MVFGYHSWEDLGYHFWGYVLGFVSRIENEKRLQCMIRETSDFWRARRGRDNHFVPAEQTRIE